MEWDEGMGSGELETAAKSMDDKPDPAHLVHDVASLQAVMFLQYIIMHCLLFLGFLTPPLLSYQYQCLHGNSCGPLITCCSYRLEKQKDS